MKLMYSYICRPPKEGQEYLRAEHERCTALWDRMVDIDNEFEQAVYKAACRDAPRIAEIDNDEIDPLTAQIDQAKGEDKWELIKQRRALFEERRKLLNKWRKEHKDEFKALTSERYETLKVARQETDAWWPNYNSVSQRIDAAKATCIKKGRRLRHHDPSRNDGMVCIQIQKGKTPTVMRGKETFLGGAPHDLHGNLSMITIYPPDHKNRADVEMRVDAAGNKIIFTMFFDRPLPTNCRVKGAQFSWKMVGSKWEYRMNFQVDIDHQPESPQYKRSGELVFDWTKTQDNGLRVAAVGKEELILSHQLMRRFDYLRHLQKWLDDSRNDAIEKWPDHAQFLELRNREMLQQMLENVNELPEDLLEWRRRWKLKWEEWTHLWQRIYRQRREIYRLWSRKIVREYTHLVIDDRDFSKIARKEKREHDNLLRQRANVHLLRHEVIHQANKYGSAVVGASGKVMTADNSQESSTWERRKRAKQERSQNES